MKGMSVKKIAAIAAGAALVGSALAPFVSAIGKSDVINDNGTPKVKVVVGSAAQITDAVWAGNIAAKIASLAYSEQTVTCSGSAASATCQLTNPSATVDLTVGGRSTFSLEDTKVFRTTLDSSTGSSAVEVDNQNITKAALPYLLDKQVKVRLKGDVTDILEKETLNVTVDAKFDASEEDLQDLVAYIDEGELNYTISFGSGISLNDAKGWDNTNNDSFEDTSKDNIPIYLFGELYTLQKFTENPLELTLVKPETSSKSYQEGELIQGIAGDGPYKGKTVSLKVKRVAVTGEEDDYHVVFALVVDGQEVAESDEVYSGENAKDSLVSDDGENLILDNVFVSSIYKTVATGLPGVSIRKGSDTLIIRNNAEFPYDNDNNTSDDYYRATINYSSTAKDLMGITISNYKKTWTYDTKGKTSPLYPTFPGQSLKGKTGKPAVFGEELPVGRNYFKVDFKGFDYSGRTMDAVIIGENAPIELGSGSGIVYTAANGTNKIPFYYTVSAGEDESLTIYKEGGVTADIKVTYDGSTNKIYICNPTVVECNSGSSPIQTISLSSPTSLYNANYYDVDTKFGGLSPVNYDVILSEDGKDIFFVLSENTGAPFVTNNGKQIYFYGTGLTKAASDIKEEGEFGTVTVGSPGTVYYCYDCNPANGNTRDFIKAYVPKSTKVSNWGNTSNNPFKNSDAYFTAYFLVKDSGYGTVVTVNTNTGGLLPIGNEKLENRGYNAAVFGVSSYTLSNFDGTDAVNSFAELMVAGTAKLELSNDEEDDDAYTAAYIDNGTKVWLEESEDNTKLRIPNSAADILVTVYGGEQAVTVEGGESKKALKKGDTFTTTDGVVVKIDDVSITASCTAAGTGQATCTPSVAKAVVPATVGNLVVLDNDATTGPFVIVGGPIVNKIAKQYEEEIALNTAGQKVVQKLSSGDIIVAGYTAQDTISAAREFIQAISQ
ncbi:MAG: S-layer protein [Candidatus Diapherotrites archaeon]|nr:S-layer protein [Candidatus Diapherotrites archaeon]